MKSITHLMSCEGIYNFPHGTVEIGKNESFIEDVKNAWEQVLERFIEDY